MKRKVEEEESEGSEESTEEDSGDELGSVDGILKTVS